jgi:hypothetical protein
LLNRAVSLADGETAAAEAAVREAVSALDRAAQKGVIHANAAARSKSRLLKRFNLAVAGKVAAGASAAAPPADAPADAAAQGGRRRGVLRRGQEAAPETPPRAARSRRGSTESGSEQSPAPRSRSRRTTE